MYRWGSRRDAVRDLQMASAIGRGSGSRLESLEGAPERRVGRAKRKMGEKESTHRELPVRGRIVQGPFKEY